MREDHLSAIRKFEGFTARGTWDCKQVSSGYGTVAKFAGEVIDKAEAERRFRKEIDEAHRAVMKFAPHLDEGSAAALTSLTFNAGASWMRSGLGVAVKADDLDQARMVFNEYNKAGGTVLPGLVARREAEAEWFGSGARPAVTGTAARIAPSATPVVPEAGPTGPVAHLRNSASGISAGLATSSPNPDGKSIRREDRSNETMTALAPVASAAVSERVPSWAPRHWTQKVSSVRSH